MFGYPHRARDRKESCGSLNASALKCRRFTSLITENARK